MFLIRVNCKVGMKWTTAEEEEGVNMLLKNVCCLCYMATSLHGHILFASANEKQQKYFRQLQSLGTVY